MSHQIDENYHKFHKTTMSYGEAEKYILLGWKLESIAKVELKGINKEYEECKLIWNRDDNPIEPQL